MKKGARKGKEKEPRTGMDKEQGTTKAFQEMDTDSDEHVSLVEFCSFVQRSKEMRTRTLREQCGEWRRFCRAPRLLVSLQDASFWLQDFAIALRTSSAASSILRHRQAAFCHLRLPYKRLCLRRGPAARERTCPATNSIAAARESTRRAALHAESAAEQRSALRTAITQPEPNDATRRTGRRRSAQA